MQFFSGNNSHQNLDMRTKISQVYKNDVVFAYCGEYFFHLKLKIY